MLDSSLKSKLHSWLHACVFIISGIGTPGMLLGKRLYVVLRVSVIHICVDI